MHAPVQRHPTRAEQLDILVSLISDITNPDDRVLDLGCGTSYAAHLLAAYREDLNYTGVDLKPESLTAAAEQFPTERHRWV
jgi:tRNA (cmo5U34)-methyltransferase